MVEPMKEKGRKVFLKFVLLLVILFGVLLVINSINSNPSALMIYRSGFEMGKM